MVLEWCGVVWCITHLLTTRHHHHHYHHTSYVHTRKVKSTYSIHVPRLYGAIPNHTHRKEGRGKGGGKMRYRYKRRSQASQIASSTPISYQHITHTGGCFHSVTRPFFFLRAAISMQFHPIRLVCFVWNSRDIFEGRRASLEEKE